MAQIIKELVKGYEFLFVELGSKYRGNFTNASYRPLRVTEMAYYPAFQTRTRPTGSLCLRPSPDSLSLACTCGSSRTTGPR